MPPTGAPQTSGSVRPPDDERARRCKFKLHVFMHLGAVATTPCAVAFGIKPQKPNAGENAGDDDRAAAPASAGASADDHVRDCNSAITGNAGTASLVAGADAASQDADQGISRTGAVGSVHGGADSPDINARQPQLGEIPADIAQETDPTTTRSGDEGLSMSSAPAPACDVVVQAEDANVATEAIGDSVAIELTHAAAAADGDIEHSHTETPAPVDEFVLPGCTALTPVARKTFRPLPATLLDYCDIGLGFFRDGGAAKVCSNAAPYFLVVLRPGTKNAQSCSLELSLHARSRSSLCAEYSSRCVTTPATRPWLCTSRRHDLKVDVARPCTNVHLCLRLRGTFLLLLVDTGAQNLDHAILEVSIISISQDLGADLTTTQWILTSYYVANCGTSLCSCRCHQ